MNGPYLIGTCADGGFTVKLASTREGCYWPTVFASTDLDDALGYIKDKLEPIPNAPHPTPTNRNIPRSRED